MSETPETDAFLEGNPAFALPDFARNLERQRDEAVARVRDIQDELQQSNGGKGPNSALNVHLLSLTTAFLASIGEGRK